MHPGDTPFVIGFREALSWADSRPIPLIHFCKSDGGVGRNPLLRRSPPSSVTASPDQLVLPGELPGVGVVERLALGLGVHPLVRRARAGIDVPAGGRVRRIAVDCVLQAQSSGERALLGVGLLDPDLRSTGTTAAEVAVRVATDGLV